MNSGPVTWVNVVGILVLVFVALMFVGTIVGSCLALSGRPGSGLRRVGLGIALPCGSVLAILLLLSLTLVGVRSTRQTTSQPPVPPQGHAELQVKPPQPVPLPIQQPVTSPADAAEAVNQLTPHDDRTASENPADKLPEWTTRMHDRQGDVTYVVLASQQFATVEEARGNVAALAKQRLADDFQGVYGVPSREITNLPDETIKQLAVRQEYVETVQRDFGSFFAPMHRVWWQVEVSPAVRTGLHPYWKSRVQEVRTIIVGAAIFDATLLFAGISWFVRRRRRLASIPPAPAATAAKPSVAVLGVGAATLLAQRCQRWWHR